MKRSLGVGEWIRRGLGAAILIAVAAIALGLDTGFLTACPRKHGFARTRLARQIPFRGGHPTTAVRDHVRRPRDDDSNPP